MLTIPGEKSRFCDGISRRGFLRIGGLGLGGLALPDLLRAEVQSGIRSSHKAVIMIYLPGGPSHLDIFDLKPEAPSNIRGEFMPISTKVPGIQICEHLPRMAAMMDKLAIIRSIVGSEGDHNAFQCMTGRPSRNQVPGGWPSLGSTISKLQGPVNPAVPPFVGLAPKMNLAPYGDPGQPGFLGVAHAPFRPEGPGKADTILDGVTLERLADRQSLLAGFDRFRRDVDASGSMGGLDAFTEQAFGILTSSKLVEALDLRREDKRLVERYGKGDPNPVYDAAPRMLEHFLIARRLVEAGARCVTLAFSRWDHHGSQPFEQNFKALREDLPMLDQGVTALVEDLRQRGMDRDVSVIVWGEFGRTPIINNYGSRDHWPNVSCALLAGGGMKTGQVVGATDRLGGEVANRPVQFGEVFATLYHNLGIDVSKVTIPDHSGRPQYLVEGGCQPMPELV